MGAWESKKSFMDGNFIDPVDGGISNLQTTRYAGGILRLATMCWLQEGFDPKPLPYKTSAPNDDLSPALFSPRDLIDPRHTPVCARMWPVAPRCCAPDDTAAVSATWRLDPSRRVLAVDKIHFARLGRWFMRGFIGLHASQLVQDSIHPQYPHLGRLKVILGLASANFPRSP